MTMMKKSNKRLLFGAIGTIAVIFMISIVFRINASPEQMLTNNSPAVKGELSEKIGNEHSRGISMKLKTFNTITILGNFNIHIKKGSTPKITILGSRNIRRVVQYQVNHGNLKIKIASDKNSKSHHNSDVIVEFDNTINQIDSMGSNNLDISDLDSSKLSLNLAGNTLKCQLAGKVNSFSINAAGQFNVNAKKLATINTSIALAGQGKAIVNVKKKLLVAGFGQGTIYYYGNPTKIEQHALGELKMINMSEHENKK